MQQNNKNSSPIIIHQTLSQDLNQLKSNQRSIAEPQVQNLQIAHDGFTHLDHIQSNDHTNILLEVLKNSKKDKTYSDLNGLKEQEKQGNNRFQNKSVQISLPQPLQSQQQLSREAQYLSYLENPPLEELEPQPSQNLTQSKILRQNLKGPFRQEFLSILYQCAIYVKKEYRRTKVDDNLLADRLADHIVVKTNPEPRSIIGTALLVNGFFICAFTILLARINQSLSLFQYVFNQFKQKSGDIQENCEDFMYYAFRPVQQFHIIQQDESNLIKSRSTLKSRNERMFGKNSEYYKIQHESLKRNNINYEQEKIDNQENQNEQQNIQDNKNINTLNSTRFTVNEVLKITTRKQSQC